MKLAIFNNTPKSGSSLFALNLSVALAQRGETVLLISPDNSASAISQSQYPRLSFWRGGLNHVESNDGEWQSAQQRFTFLILDLESENPSQSLSILTNCDEVIVPLPEARYTMSSLPQTLKIIKDAKAQNSSLNLRSIVETKHQPGQNGSRDEKAEAGTMDTIKILFPKLNEWPVVEDSDDYHSSFKSNRSSLENDPESDASKAFRTMAQSLAPGEKNDATLRRALKRHAKGKPPAEDNVFSVIGDKLSTLFGG